MTLAVAVLGVLVAVLLLFVVALLRSHAEILRRLAGIEASLDLGALAPSAAGGPLEVRSAGANLRRGQRASDIGGQTLGGDMVQVSLGAAAPPTLLAFMGTTCHACAPLWEGLHAGPVPTPSGARLVVVTKGPDRERLARLLELAPADVAVIMSSQAWQDYEVPSTPHFVLVREGQIVGRGAATSWAQITTFLTDADDDDRIYRSRTLNTEGRAARAERALTEAGIGPGHPSLYPGQGPKDATDA
jgi:hypothetical protein